MVDVHTEVWVHGLIPGCSVSEISLRQFLTSREADMPLTPDLAQWQSLAADAFGMSAVQAAACMRLCFVLSQPSGHSLPLPTDDALRAPIGSLLLLLWVQWAHHELGESCATNVQRAQAADGEVWPSLHLPPAAAAAAALVDGKSQPSARTLAVQQRLHSAPQLARRRRKLLQSSLPTLLQLVGLGAERLYASEFDRLALLLRPDDASTARLLARAEKPGSLSASLGLFSANPQAALPINGLVAGLRAALVEVGGRAPAAAPASTGKGNGAAGPTRSPLAVAPSASANAPGAGGADGEAPPPPTPNTPLGGAVGTSPQSAPFRISVSISDTEDARGGHDGSPTRGTLVLSNEGCKAPGGAVLRLAGAKRRTLCLREKELSHGSLQLIDCHGCYIYALAPLRSVEILGCTGCTFMLGAVSGVLSASHCEGSKLVFTAKAARLSNCIDTYLYLCVNSPPLVFGENHRVHLAPFATVYGGLAEHMAHSQLSPALGRNCWDEPVALASGSSSGALASPPAVAPPSTDKDGEAPPSGCALLPPAKFLPFNVPMDVPAAAAHGEGVAPLCELPTEYSTALLAHVQRLARFRDEIGALSCSDEVRRDVQRTVSAGFQDWLHRTGNIRQLADLASQPSW